MRFLCTDSTLVIDDSSFSGVEDVKAEMALNKLTVVGKVDPMKLRDKLSQKTKKNVELVSPLPPKKDNKAAADDNKPEKKAEDKKPKEVSLSANMRRSLSLSLLFCTVVVVFF